MMFNLAQALGALVLAGRYVCVDRSVTIACSGRMGVNAHVILLLAEKGGIKARAWLRGVMSFTLSLSSRLEKHTRSHTRVSTHNNREATRLAGYTARVTRLEASLDALHREGENGAGGRVLEQVSACVCACVRVCECVCV